MPASIVDLEDMNTTSQPRRIRLLLVEDEVIVAEDVKKRLQNIGYDVVGVATRGQEAIEMASSLHPHLVLMDIGLRGGMDGIETVKRMREKVDLPVIFASAYSDDATLQRARDAAPQGFVLKPFEERELRATIEMAIQKYSAEKQLREHENLFSRVFEFLPDGLYVENANGEAQLVNKAFRRIFRIPDSLDLTKAGAQSEKAGHLNPFAGNAPHARRMAAAREAAQPVVEEPLVLTDGRTILMSYTPIGALNEHRIHLWQFHEVPSPAGRK